MLKKRRRKIKRENKQTNKNKQCRKNYKENTSTKLISNTKKHKLKIQGKVWDFRYTMLHKRRRKRNREKKDVTEIIKKNYRYKIDNIYQKAKIKNLEQGLEFQNYNVKEKKKKKKTRSKNYKKYIYEVC